MRIIMVYFMWVGKIQQREREKKIKKQRTTGVIFWKRAGRMGSSAHVEGLALARSTDGSCIVTEEEMEYPGTNARRWLMWPWELCGNSFLIASIFSEK